jgi:hypothetical protein
MTLNVTLTAMHGRALFSLLTMHDGALLERPATEVARSLAIDTSGATRHLAALKKAGLLVPVRRYGVKLVLPDQGWVWHRHKRGLPCHGCLVEQGLHAAEIHDVLTTHFTTEQTTCSRYVMEGQMGIQDAIKRIKGEVQIHERARGRRGASKRQAQILLTFYTTARRRCTPGYQPTAGDGKKAAQATRVLASRLVSQELYQKYVEYAFGVFERMKRGSMKYPPVAFLKSETIIDNFVGSLGRRQINVERAYEMMQKKGLGSVDPGLAVSIARNCWEQDLAPPPGLEDDLAKAVDLIMSRITDIGYRSEPA